MFRECFFTIFFNNMPQKRREVRSGPRVCTKTSAQAKEKFYKWLNISEKTPITREVQPHVVRLNLTISWCFKEKLEKTVVEWILYETTYA